MACKLLGLDASGISVGLRDRPTIGMRHRQACCTRAPMMLIGIGRRRHRSVSGSVRLRRTAGFRIMKESRHGSVTAGERDDGFRLDGGRKRTAPPTVSMGGAVHPVGAALLGAPSSSPSHAQQLPTAKAESAAKEENRHVVHDGEAIRGTRVVKRRHPTTLYLGPPPVVPASWFSFSFACSNASSTLKLAGF